jgi:hypothetical protein
MSDTTESTLAAPAERGRRRVKDIAADLNARLVALPGLAQEDLRLEWRRLHRADPPKRIGREILELGVAWKLRRERDDWPAAWPA